MHILVNLPGRESAQDTEDCAGRQPLLLQNRSNGLWILQSLHRTLSVERVGGRRHTLLGSRYFLSMVSLRPITESNREAVEALEVSAEQQNFVSNAADSIREAAREPDGRALYWAIYADETPVGFVMVSDDVGGPDYFPQYLWKLFIDQRYQGRGYGTATLDLIAEYFRRRPEVELMRTSCGQGKGSPLGFYERYGFEQTGEIVFDNEILLQLELR
jgi:diamine N-acetyltransferase